MPRWSLTFSCPCVVSNLSHAWLEMLVKSHHLKVQAKVYLHLRAPCIHGSTLVLLPAGNLKLLPTKWVTEMAAVSPLDCGEAPTSALARMAKEGEIFVWGFYQPVLWGLGWDTDRIEQSIRSRRALGQGWGRGRQGGPLRAGLNFTVLSSWLTLYLGLWHPEVLHLTLQKATLHIGLFFNAFRLFCKFMWY